MKLRLLSILLAAVTAIPMALSSFGAENEILYGTPSVDGLVDQLYFKSLEVPLDSVGEDCSITQGTTYLLWNNNYIYFCAVSYEKPTKNSAVCFCINDNALYQTIAISADGDVLACTEGADCTFSIDNSKVRTKLFDDHYVVEAAIAFDSIGAGKKIGFNTMYFDNYYDYTYSMGGHFLFNEFELSSQAAQNVAPDMTDADPVSGAPEISALPSTDVLPDSTSSSALTADNASGTDAGEQGNEQSGCNSALGGLSLLLVLPATAALTAVRKKKR